MIVPDVGRSYFSSPVLVKGLLLLLFCLAKSENQYLQASRLLLFCYYFVKYLKLSNVLDKRVKQISE